MPDRAQPRPCKGKRQSKALHRCNWSQLRQEIATDWLNRCGAERRLSSPDSERSCDGASTEDHQQAVWARLYKQCRRVRLTENHRNKLRIIAAELLHRRVQTWHRKARRHIQITISAAHANSIRSVDNEFSEIDTLRRRFIALREKARPDPLVHAIICCVLRSHEPLRDHWEAEVRNGRHVSDGELNLRDDAKLSRLLAYDIKEIRKAKKRLKTLMDAVTKEFPD